MFNIAVYQCEKVRVERCIVQNFKGLQFNTGVRELVFVDNRMGFEHGARTSTYMSRVEDLFRLIPEDNRIEKLEIGFRDSTLDEIKRCIKVESRKTKRIQSLKIRLKTSNSEYSLV